MFNHVVVGSNDLEKSRQFYDAVLGALGVDAGRSDHNERRRRYVYRTKTGAFFITQPIDGQPASPANGGTIGFSCQSIEEVNRWHAAGVANGGKSVEEPPGLRGPSAGGVYLAYLRDPDNNKLCAVYRMPAYANNTSEPTHPNYTVGRG